MGADSYLQISQVVVMAGSTNVALGKPCSSSSQLGVETPCTKAVDGNTSLRALPNLYSSNSPNGDTMTIDLMAEYAVTSVVYYNRLVSVFSYVLI